jgi:hypothetical protein
VANAVPRELVTAHRGLCHTRGVLLDIGPVVATVVAVATGAVAIVPLLKRHASNDVDRERERLEATVLKKPSVVTVKSYSRGDGAYVRAHYRRDYSGGLVRIFRSVFSDSRPHTDPDYVRSEGDDGHTPEDVIPPPSNGSTRSAEASFISEESERFTRLLVEYYAHGLSQARRSSAASLVSSALGAGVLLVGVVIVVVRSGTGAGQYGSVVVTLAGAVTNAVGVLFHRQANRALQHIESQTRNLRQDMKSDRDAHDAVVLLQDVDDARLQDQLRAALVLRLTGATLPDVSVPPCASQAPSESGRLEVVNPLLPDQHGAS